MWLIATWFIKICVPFITDFVKTLRKVFKIIVFNLHFSIFYMCFMLLLIIWPFPILNGRTVKNGKIWARMLKRLTTLMRVKWELRNGEILARDRGAVIVCNHQSTLDIVGIFNVWETADKLTVIAKKTVLYAGPLGVMAYFVGVIFINRTDPKSAYKQLEDAANMINEKVKIWMFPEGTRNFDYTKFLPFKKGAFTLAVTAQAPIIPVVCSPYYFIDRKNYTASRGRVIIQCLQEVPTTGLTMDDVPELIERVRNVMLAAYKQLSDEVLTNASRLHVKDNNRPKSIQ